MKYDRLVEPLDVSVSYNPSTRTLGGRSREGEDHVNSIIECFCRHMGTNHGDETHVDLEETRYKCKDALQLS